MNLIFVTIDTLRADHLSCYGYPRKTSPNIDELAERGVVFEDFRSVGNCTQPGFTAMLTGLHPERSGIVCHWTKETLADNVPMLAERFAAAGYTTAAIDNLFDGWVHRGYPTYPWFRRGFQTYGYPPAPEESFHRSSQDVANAALEWLATAPTTPFFLFLHMWNPHAPYNKAPKEFYRFYSGDPCAADQDTMPRQVRDQQRRYFGLEVTDPRFVVAAYDAEIAFSDQAVGTILDALHGLGLSEDTVVLITSDHGEIMTRPRLAVGRSWCFSHIGLNEDNLCVPLIVSGGPVAQGARVKGLHQLVDIVPTLIELFDLAPADTLDGRGLAEALAGGNVPGREEVFFSENTYQKQRACLAPPWKAMRMEEDAQTMPRKCLYNLAADPAEEVNLADSLPERMSELEARMDAHVARCTQGGEDPLLVQELSKILAPPVATTVF